MFLLRLPALLLMCVALLAGCGKDEPSRADFEDFFRSTIAQYALYREHFEVGALERTNGWKEQEHYVIQGTATLRAKGGYTDLLADTVDELERELQSNPMGQMGLGLVRMARSVNGEGQAFETYWSQQQADGAVPARLVATQARLKPEYFAALLHQADSWLLENYGSIIGRQLRAGDTLQRVYTLSFRKTEQGWKGFNAQ